MKKARNVALTLTVATGLILPSAAGAAVLTNKDNFDLKVQNSSSAHVSGYVLERDGDTWKASYPHHPITLYHTINYYDSATGANATGQLAPQQVMVTDISNNFKRYKIETIYGDKWINVPYRKNITLKSSTGVFDSPTAVKPDWTTQPDTYLAVAEEGDWLQIVTKNGLEWIKNPLVVGFHDLEFTTYFFDEVNGKSSTGSVSAQTVKVLDRSGNWLQIDTSYGPKWIFNDYSYPLYKETKTHASVNGDNTGAIAPQTVRVVNATADYSWLQVDTYKGYQWIVNPQYFKVDVPRATEYYTNNRSVRADATTGAGEYVALTESGEWYEIHIPEVGNKWIKKSSVLNASKPLNWTDYVKFEDITRAEVDTY